MHALLIATVLAVALQLRSAAQPVAVLGVLGGMLAACSTFSGPPCQHLLAADPHSVDARQCLIEHYPATLPPCARWLPAISVEEALDDHHLTGETVTVRGRLAMPDGSCTDMACGPATCCNDCNVGFSLVGDAKRELPLERWEQAPQLRMDCDFSVPRPWLAKLVLQVSGVVVDEPIYGQPGGDPLAPPPSSRSLTVEQTCRAE
jgi:hypothetical protein